MPDTRDFVITARIIATITIATGAAIGTGFALSGHGLLTQADVNLLQEKMDFLFVTRLSVPLFICVVPGRAANASQQEYFGFLME